MPSKIKQKKIMLGADGGVDVSPLTHSGFTHFSPTGVWGRTGPQLPSLYKIPFPFFRPSKSNISSLYLYPPPPGSSSEAEVKRALSAKGVGTTKVSFIGKRNPHHRFSSQG